MLSQRAARMERRHERGKAGTALNLVSLMDIFTILVFFLMVNSSDVEVLETTSDIRLPDSTGDSNNQGDWKRKKDDSKMISLKN